MKLITVHGIRASNLWFRKLEESEELEQRGMQIKHFRYGYLTLVGFLTPWRRAKIINDFLRFYDENVGANERPSVVAHSFGTWIIFSAIRMYPSIKFDRVIFFGSILNPDTDLEVFFGKDQVRLFRHEVGEQDSVVSWSRVALGKDAGESGKVGFTVIPNRYKRKIIQDFFPKFAHGSAAFLQHHINENWIPFLVSQSFNVKPNIARVEVMMRVNARNITDNISFPKRDFVCRVDRLGNYYARYSLVIRNNSDQPLTGIPISISADSSDQLVDMSFCPLDNELALISYDLLGDDFHYKSIDLRIPPLAAGNQQLIHYAFKLSRTINYSSGDTDHYDIRRAREITATFQSFYRLVSARFFAVRGGQLITEVACREDRRPDGTWDYHATHTNDKGDEGLLFYFEGCHPEQQTEKHRFRTNIEHKVDAARYTIRNATENDLAKIEALELSIEGRDRRALGGTIIERFRMFPDGFLVVEQGGKIHGYIESLVWKHRDFDTFDHIKDFPLHHDTAERELYVIFLATSQSERRKGLGSKLLEAIEAVAKQYQADHVTLVAKSNLKDFYEKRGYISQRVLHQFLESSEGIYMRKAMR